MADEEIALLPAEEVEQLPSDVEEAETDPRPEHPIVLPEEPPVEPDTPVEGPVNPDNELPEIDQPYPDNGLPEAPVIDNTLPEIPEEPEVPTDPTQPMPVPEPEPVELDAAETVSNIVAAARKRCEKYRAQEAGPGRRGPANATFACVLATAADLYPSPEQILVAIQNAAAEWLSGYTGGNVARRHTLAQRIIDGRYNVAKK